MTMGVAINPMDADYETWLNYRDRLDAYLDSQVNLLPTASSAVLISHKVS